MPELVLTPRFSRAYARYTKRNENRRGGVDQALARLAANPMDGRLKTHQLSGDLAGFHACSCGYDCRILFAWERQKKPETVVLIAVGTHDEVY